VKFKHHGRTYTIYKRAKTKDAPYYFRITRGGNVQQTSLKINVAATAVTKAKLMLDAADQGELDHLRDVLSRGRTKPKCITIGELITAWDNATIDAGQGHKDNCTNCIRLVLSRALGKETGQVDELSTSVFTAAIADAYFEQCLKLAQAEPNQAAAARVKRSANSIWRQAVCLLRPKLIAIYRRKGLVVPDVEPFLKVFKSEKFTGVDTIYNPPPDDVIRKTLVEWRRMKDRNMFIATGLELSCGLRKGEIIQTTWRMLTGRMNGSPVVRGISEGETEVDVKNQSGGFEVPPINPFWRVFNHRIDQESWRGELDDLILKGTPTEINDLTFRNIGAWQRGLGWKTQKTNHALRAYSGCLVAMKYGIYRASAWLRHKSVTTTEQNYSHFLNSHVFTPDKVFIRWAT
jgi:integrase